MPEKTVTAAILIIGDEILSGRTIDTNTNTIAKALTQAGIRLMEVHTIPDDIALISARINAFREKFDYVFTSGGIGPTHDDKTAQALAEAFERPLSLNQEAYQLLVTHYGSENNINEGRRKMAYLPEGAQLIHNPISAAPGIQMDNVFVLAGVPDIMKSMLDTIMPHLKKGAIMESENIICDGVAESDMAPALEYIENNYDSVEIGSYPRYKDGAPSLSIVVRSTKSQDLKNAANDVRVALADLK